MKPTTKVTIANFSILFGIIITLMPMYAIYINSHDMTLDSLILSSLILLTPGLIILIWGLFFREKHKAIKSSNIMGTKIMFTTLIGSILLAFFLILYINLESHNIHNNSSANKKVTNNEKGNNSIKIEIIKSGFYGDMYEVKIKITNVGSKNIHNARVTCILLDNFENEIDFKKHYIIKSTEGGLPAGKTTYFTYMIGPISKSVHKIKFNFDEIKYNF